MTYLEQNAQTQNYIHARMISRTKQDAFLYLGKHTHTHTKTHTQRDTYKYAYASNIFRIFLQSIIKSQYPLDYGLHILLTDVFLFMAMHIDICKSFLYIIVNIYIILLLSNHF